MTISVREPVEFVALAAQDIDLVAALTVEVFAEVSAARTVELDGFCTRDVTFQVVETP